MAANDLEQEIEPFRGCQAGVVPSILGVGLLERIEYAYHAIHTSSLSRPARSRDDGTPSNRAQCSHQTAKDAQMGGEAREDIARRLFVVRVCGAIAVLEHRQPIHLGISPAGFEGELHTPFGRSAVEALLTSVLLDQPSELKTELESLNRGVARDGGFRRGERFVEPIERLAERLRPRCHNATQ